MTEDVAKAIQLLTSSGTEEHQSCDFAIKSGGHYTTFNNIDGGVLLDLSRLNSINLSEDRRTATIGSGAVWADVYAKLSPHDVTVVGGRVGEVAIGGFTLGAGISFHSPRYGFASDRVVEFEIVLAGGHVVRARADNEHADLHAALKGSHNALGVVTKITFETIPLGGVFGGGIMAPLTGETKVGNLKALADMSVNYDIESSIATIIMYNKAMGGFTVYSNLFYAKPDDTAFRMYRDVEPESQMVNTMRLTTLEDLVKEAAGPPRPQEPRRSLYTGTFKADYYTISTIVDEFERFVSEKAAKEGIAGLGVNLIFEAMPASMVAASANAGQSILGWQERNQKENLMIWVTTWGWSEQDDDKKVEQLGDELYGILNRIYEENETKRPYVFLNYASKKQDVFGSYGGNAVQKLRAVSKRYDPEGAFWKRRKGFVIPN